ncbi:hypothetical protein DB32_006856 [Sandaracinus amylolyticus]|uniref:Uncharacterized protein n=1 Tax=Sandaracinus amylolyticus TaxID=927083 RepID=A0A0F6YMW8_9BACT|nr:hypothetical protein DB32_006856 [Sandaracinus amylolyticus]
MRGASDGIADGRGTSGRGDGVPSDPPSGSVGRALGDGITIVRSPESVPAVLGSASGIAKIAAPHVAHCTRSIRPRTLPSATEYLEPHFEHVIFIATSPGTDLGARDRRRPLDHSARTGETSLRVAHRPAPSARDAGRCRRGRHETARDVARRHAARCAARSRHARRRGRSAAALPRSGTVPRCAERSEARGDDRRGRLVRAA